MYVIVNSINHSRYKAISRPFTYMMDAESALEEIRADYDANGIQTKTVDDRSFICFVSKVPSFFKVVKDDRSTEYLASNKTSSPGR